MSDHAMGVVVVPSWPTQIWYPLLLRLLAAPPVKLQAHPQFLTLPEYPQVVHPLHPKLNLIVCLLTSNSTRNAAFQTLQLK